MQNLNFLNEAYHPARHRSSQISDNIKMILNKKFSGDRGRGRQTIFVFVFIFFNLSSWSRLGSLRESNEKREEKKKSAAMKMRIIDSESKESKE